MPTPLIVTLLLENILFRSVVAGRTDGGSDTFVWQQSWTYSAGNLQARVKFKSVQIMGKDGLTVNENVSAGTNKGILS